MIRLEIDSQDLNEIKGVSAKNGKPYHLRLQSGYAHVVGPDGKASKYPEKFEIMLESDEAPFPSGMYTLHPSSLVIRDGRMVLAPRLAPIKA
jgi:hypothetical protein